MRLGPKQRILLILLLATLVRLIHISAQPLGHHGWRQADTAAVARNFQENGHRLLYPEIDWMVPGYVEMEFPLYPWVTSLAYAGLGQHVALARLLAALASVGSVWLLFLLVKSILGPEEGLWAAFLWAILPLSIYFGRAIMPEAWMLAFSIAGVLLFLRWLDRPFWILLISAAVSVSLACLLKPTALLLGLPLLWLAWRKYGWSLAGRWQLWLFGAIVLVPVIAWYWHAYRLGVTYGATFGVLSGPTGKLATWTILADPGFYHRLFFEFFANRILTWFGFIVLLVGLALPRRNHRERLFDWWLLGVVVVLLLGSAASSVHEYYSLPLLIPSVAIMGKALVWIRQRSRFVLALLVCGIVLASGARASSYLEREGTGFGVNQKVAEDLYVASLLESLTEPSGLVLVCDFDPTWFYLSHRKGFGRNCDLMNKRSVAALEEKGARYLVGRRADFRSSEGQALLEHLLATRVVLHDSGEVVLVDLSRKDRTTWRRQRAGSPGDDGWSADSVFEVGSWDEQNGVLRGRPVKRRLAANLGPTSCSLCAVRIALTPASISPESRRKSEVTVRAWSTGTASLDVTLDLAGSRVLVEQVRNRAVLGRAARAWPIEDDETYELEVLFDNFDFEVRLDGQFVLAVPSEIPADPAGRVLLAGFNVGLAIADFEMVAPATVEAVQRELIDVAPVWAGHPVNFAIVTEGEFQYVGFYDPERRMTVAQRKLDSSRWTFTKLPSRVEWDSHNDISMEVDRDGYLHVSGNMHGDRLVYFRSAGPHDISGFERPRMVASREKKVTYPRFLEGGDGRLYFHYRDGKSGAGSTILNRYEEASQSWSRVLPGPLFEGNGEMNAYLSGPVVGPGGWFHLVWMWRDTPSAATNHDVSYARSHDLERWETAAGDLAPVPFTPRSTGVVVDPVRTGAGLSGNAFGVGWDARKRPVVSYVKYGPSGDSQLFNARFEGDQWKIRQTSSWSYRWDLDATGSLPARVGFYPVSVDRSGRLIQAFDHVSEGRGAWVLDEGTLLPTGRVEEPAFFGKLRTVESKFPGMEVRPLIRDRTGKYLLRWETLPIQRDRPREPPYPPPSLLRVFRIPSNGDATVAVTD